MCVSFPFENKAEIGAGEASSQALQLSSNGKKRSKVKMAKSFYPTMHRGKLNWML